ncbi:MAG: TetR/AcrR family transcriptional regulator [Desulfobacterota bacterium]|jgi:AcrR family transcriptional regulator|nr:TetR/AcrR family transcriptional regulator [Thermodesulfobacteriota bacterium]
MDTDHTAPGQSAFPPPAPVDGNVRERLLNKAARLFARKGYAATTVREIVAEAGVTKPVLYYYFRSKEGIYSELLQEALKRFEALLEEARQRRGRAVERLLFLTDRVLALFLDQIEVARLAYSVYYGPPQGTPDFDLDAYHFKFQARLTALVREGFDNREFRRGTVEDVTWLVLAILNMALELQLSHPEKGFGRENLRRILKLMVAGLQGPASAERENCS